MPRLHKTGSARDVDWGTHLMAELSRRRYQASGLIYQDRQKEQSQLSVCWRRLHPASPSKEAATMNLSKPVNPIRNYAFGSVITALILFSPVFAFLVAVTRHWHKFAVESPPPGA